MAQIIGIDKSKEMVSIYSENVKRQAHPAYTMQADASNFILQSEVNSDAWLTSSESEIQVTDYDLTLISINNSYHAPTRMFY